MDFSLLIVPVFMIAFFVGWAIGGTIREKRLRKEIEGEQARLYADAATKVLNKEITKRDNLVCKQVWQAQKEYIATMIDCVDKGFTIDEMRTMFDAQLELVEQEIAVENTKEILL